METSQKTAPIPATREYVDNLKKTYAAMPVMPMQLFTNNPCFTDSGVDYTLEPYIDELLEFEKEVKESKAESASPLEKILGEIFGKVGKGLNNNMAIERLKRPLVSALKGVFIEADSLNQEPESLKNVTVACAEVEFGGVRYQVQVSLAAQPEMWLDPGIATITRINGITRSEVVADGAEADQ